MFGAGSRARTAPSQYPRLPFHLLRTMQLISSLIVGSIMAYFVYHLHQEGYDTPWTFVWLFTASLLSIAALSLTIFMHCCIGLSPRLNLLINGALSVIWGGGWCVLTWFLSPTLNGWCNIDNWNRDLGVMVCRIYKALFTFALLGFFSTLGAFILDIHVRRQQTRSGIYMLHDMETQNTRKQREQFFPAGLQFAPVTNHAQGYSQPEGQYRYETEYQGTQHN